MGTLFVFRSLNDADARFCFTGSVKTFGKRNKEAIPFPCFTKAGVF
jgi:hypothetical protein